MHIRTLLALCCLGALASCATVVRGSNEVLRINSTPSGARVIVSNGMSCDATPCELRMPRQSDVVVTVSRFNCETQQVRVQGQIARRGAAGMAGNVVTAGIVGVAVDGATGATLSLTPNPVNVRLTCMRPATSVFIPATPTTP